MRGAKEKRVGDSYSTCNYETGLAHACSNSESGYMDNYCRGHYRKAWGPGGTLFRLSGCYGALMCNFEFIVHRCTRKCVDTHYTNNVFSFFPKEKESVTVLSSGLHFPH